MRERQTRLAAWENTAKEIEKNSTTGKQLEKEVEQKFKTIEGRSQNNKTLSDDSAKLIKEREGLRAEMTKPPEDPLILTLLTGLGNGLQWMVTHPIATLTTAAGVGLIGTVVYSYRNEISSALGGNQTTGVSNVGTTNITINMSTPTASLTPSKISMEEL